MALVLLSGPWCARATELFASVVVPRALAARARYVVADAGARAGTQTVRDGRIEWEAGAFGDADIELHWDEPDAIAILARRVDGTEATARTKIVARRPGSGWTRGYAPPLDLAERPELRHMPFVARASLQMACKLVDGPFGDVYCTFSFTDGRLYAISLGVGDEIDVTATVPFGAYVRFERGEITSLEVLECGTVVGSQGALALLRGLVEDPAYRAAMASAVTGRAAPALAVIGEVAAMPVYQEAMERVLLETTRSVRTA